MPAKRLNSDLLLKMGKKSGNMQALRVRISKKAGKLGISSTAAQLVVAKELGIGIGNALAKVSADVREEVRSAGATTPAAAADYKGKAAMPTKRKVVAITAATIKSLLQDRQLHARCKDILQARKHFDRVIREATTVLDDRLKTKTGISNMNPENLVGRALNPDPTKAVIEVSQDKAEQEGMHSICKGIMLVFRNKAHHSLSDKLTREDALKFCGFVDTILGVIEKATLHPDRA